MAINGTEGVWVHHKVDGSLSNDRGPLVFTADDWAVNDRREIVIRPNMYAKLGGVIRATGKFMPAPPPPPPPPPPFSAPRALVSPPPPPPPLPAFSSVAIPSDVAHLSEQHRTLLRVRGLLHKTTTNKEERKNLILRLSPVGFRLPDDDSDGESPRNVTIRKKRTQEEIQRDREESEREAMEIEESEMREKIKQEIKKKRYDAAIEELAIIEPQLDKLEKEIEKLLLIIKESEATIERYQSTGSDAKPSATDTDEDDDWGEQKITTRTLTPTELVNLSLERRANLLIEKTQCEQKIAAIEQEITNTTYDETTIKLPSDEEAELSSYKKKLTPSVGEKTKRDFLANKLDKMKRDARSAHARKAKELNTELAALTHELEITKKSIVLEEEIRRKIRTSENSLNETKAKLPALTTQYDELLRRKGTLDTEAERNKPKEDEIAFRSQTSPLGDLLKGGMGGRRLSMGHKDGDSDSESDDEDNGYVSD
jgi:hypothetical protein